MALPCKGRIIMVASAHNGRFIMVANPWVDETTIHRHLQCCASGLGCHACSFFRTLLIFADLNLVRILIFTHFLSEFRWRKIIRITAEIIIFWHITQIKKENVNF